jgi:hypothetical protein
VWGSGSDDIWVVGDAGTVLHWDGSSWVSLRTGTTASLLAVWGNGLGAAYVVGHAEGAGKFLICSGSDCLTGKVGLVPKLNCVWGSARGPVWAGGDDGTMIKFTTSFGPVAMPSPTSIRGLWGSGPDDIWAAGDAATIQHWDGTSWSVAFSDEPYVDLNAIWGSSPNDVWAVGDGVLRWNGATWEYSPPGSVLNLYGVTGTSPTDVWILAERGILLHSDDFNSGRTAWLPAYLNGIWSRGPGDVWAVGEDQGAAVIFHHQP